MSGRPQIEGSALTCVLRVPPRCSFYTADSIMVDVWEVQQKRYTRTLHVLHHVRDELRRLVDLGAAPRPEEVS